MAGSNDPKLHLIVDGVPFPPRMVGRVYTFKIPSGARRVIIASRSVVPRDADGTDPRRLGVPLHRIVLKGVGPPPIDIWPDYRGLTEGFHDDEGSHRWTNGRAVLPSELLARLTGEVSIEVHIGTIKLKYQRKPLKDKSGRSAQSSCAAARDDDGFRSDIPTV